MKTESRIRNSIRNTAYVLAGQTVTIIMQFILRSVFIRYLSISYLGAEGLFTNILSVLSLTELGLGAALVTNMYKPLALKDTRSIRAHINAYRKVYALIGAAIGVAGICLVPFLPYLIKDAAAIEGLTSIYLLYLTDSVFTYFFAHYRAMLSANQQDYVNTINRSIFIVLQVVVQIICLFLFRSFLLYLVIKIAFNLLAGFSISRTVRRMFPYLKEKDGSRITPEEKQTLVRNAVGIFSQRVGFTVMNGTDNIVISTFLGSVAVGLYSNYSLVVSTISTIIGLAMSAVQASIGNLCAVEESGKTRASFLNVDFVYFWIYSFASVCLSVLMTPFVRIWLGDRFEIGTAVIIVCVLNFYFANSRQAALAFATANGLLWKLKLKAIVEAVLNLVISIALVRPLGMLGVFVGTSVSTLATSVWIEPYILYKYYFRESVFPHYVKYAGNLAATAAAYLACTFLGGLVPVAGLTGFLIRCIICVIVTNVLYIIFFHKTEQFRYLKDLVGTILGDRRHRT